MSRKGNASPRRKRTKLTPIQKEAARIRRNEEQKQKRAAEKERRERQAEAQRAAEQEARERQEEALQEAEDERLEELNAMADAFHERSLRSQYYAGAQWHARHLGYADD